MGVEGGRRRARVFRRDARRRVQERGGKEMPKGSGSRRERACTACTVPWPPSVRRSCDCSAAARSTVSRHFDLYVIETTGCSENATSCGVSACPRVHAITVLLLFLNVTETRTISCPLESALILCAETVVQAPLSGTPATATQQSGKLSLRAMRIHWSGRGA